jgi:hypothetical protein
MPTGICGQSAASLRHRAATGVSRNLLRAGHSLAAGADSVRPDKHHQQGREESSSTTTSRSKEADQQPTQTGADQQAAATRAGAQTRSADAVRCPASPVQLTGSERPRLRRRGRDPAPVRGPAVVASSRRIPRRSPSASRTLRGPSDRPLRAALDPAVGATGRVDTPPRVGRRQRRPATTQRRRFCRNQYSEGRVLGSRPGGKPRRSLAEAVVDTAVTSPGHGS